MKILYVKYSFINKHDTRDYCYLAVLIKKLKLLKVAGFLEQILFTTSWPFIELSKVRYPAKN